MAAGELTGKTEAGLLEMRVEHQSSPLFRNHDIPFETAYCLTRIGKQPDEYDGPQRFCVKRAAKKNDDEYDGYDFDKAAYCHGCRFHGRNRAKTGRQNQDNLENPRTVTITHGAYAEDEHLMMDFTDEEQELYDSIMNDWPEIYDWPAKSEDPARYRILRRVAVNEVRATREEDYLDNHEIHEEPVYDDQGVQIGTKEIENPLAREYRLLMSEVTNQMKELGLTPKEQQKMDSLSSQADKDDALSEVARDAIHGDDTEYDPGQFDE